MANLADKLNRFVSNLNGQFVEVSSKEALYQCMDLAYLWVFALDYPKETIQNSLAYLVYTNPKPITKEYFDLIPNTPEAVPKDGDLVVWGTGFGPAGHIAIALGGGTTSSFRCFEQNAPLGTNAHISQRNYKNVLGWLRPKKFEEQTITDQTRIPQLDNKEVQQIRSELLAKDRALDACIEKLTKVEDEINDQDTTLKEPLFSHPLAQFLFQLAKTIEEKLG